MSECAVPHARLSSQLDCFLAQFLLCKGQLQCCKGARCHAPVKDAILVLRPLLREHNQLLPILTGPLLENAYEPVIDLLVLL